MRHFIGAAVCIILGIGSILLGTHARVAWAAEAGFVIIVAGAAWASWAAAPEEVED